METLHAITQREEYAQKYMVLEFKLKNQACHKGMDLLLLTFIRPAFLCTCAFCYQLLLCCSDSLCFWVYIFVKEKKVSFHLNKHTSYKRKIYYKEKWAIHGKVPLLKCLTLSYLLCFYITQKSPPPSLSLFSLIRP